MYSLKVNLHGSFLEPLTALGWAVGPVTRGGVLVRGSLWPGLGVVSKQQDRGKPNPFPHPLISFLPSSPAEPRRSGCSEIPRLSNKKPELASDHFGHLTAASGTWTRPMASGWLSGWALH